MAGDSSTFRTDSRGLSPVIGEFLLIAIAVLLSMSLGAVALGINTTPEPAPNVVFETDYTTDGDDPALTFRQTAGDTMNASQVVIKDSHGNAVTWKEITTNDAMVTASDHVVIDGQGADSALVTPDPAENPRETYYIVWESNTGESYIISEYTIDGN